MAWASSSASVASQVGSAWLRCSRETLDALSQYKARNALPTWDATLAELLAQAAPDRDGEKEAEQR